MSQTMEFFLKEFVKPEACSIFNMYNDIQFKMSKLFIDTRREKEYNKQHIRSSVNIPLTSFDLYRLDSSCILQTKIDSFIARKLYTISKIIWYGNTDFNINDSKQQLFYQRASDLINNKIIEKNKTKINLNEFKDKNDEFDKQNIPKMYILDCKYNEFESKYPFLCDNKRVSIDPNTDINAAKNELLMDFLSIYMNKKISIKDALKVYPSQIIDDQYFLGNGNQCSDEKILKNLGITHIINCTQTLNNEFERKHELNTDGFYAKYIRIPVNDIGDEEIEKYFIESIEFIENTLIINNINNNNRILCHCHAGISRSVTITIAYLMYSKCISFIDALKYIRQKREIANPNQGFRTQLSQFDKFLNAKRKILNTNKLTIDDLNGFIINNHIDDIDKNENKQDFEDIDFLRKELKNCFKHYFMTYQYDDVLFFLEKYGSMIINQFPQIFGILIEDILLNENNNNRQLFILLFVELFKLQKISNINNNFVDDVLCGCLARNVHDNLIDSPYFLQFIAALFAQLLNTKILLPHCLALFCEASIKYQRLKILNESSLSINERDKKIIIQQFELIKYQCSKIILYTLKELELLNSSEIINKFKDVKLEDVICKNAFKHSDQRFLSYICY